MRSRQGVQIFRDAHFERMCGMVKVFCIRRTREMESLFFTSGCGVLYLTGFASFFSCVPCDLRMRSGAARTP